MHSIVNVETHHDLTFAEQSGCHDNRNEPAASDVEVECNTIVANEEVRVLSVDDSYGPSKLDNNFMTEAEIGNDTKKA